jgi:hypothetical protein
MKKIFFVVFLICVALPTFADDYVSIQAEQYKEQLSMITKVYYDLNKEFGYEARVSTWLSVCGQDGLSKAVTPNSNALDKFISNRLNDRNMHGRELTDVERSRATLAIKSLYIGYTLGFKEATLNHYEDLSRKSKDESIEAAVNAGNRILEKKK